MPANPKYLTPALWPRFAKISAAIIGSYLVTVSFHLMLAAWLDRKDVIITGAFTGFIMWVALMIVTFIAKSGLKMWGLYIVATVAFLGMTYAGQLYNS
ncbi:MAG: hypothetical protein EOP06_23785 [Proteobacteria bacterium]|nr:MAG: hypothetical protein EOP06_23785 [Pseudomonadota bacterium]